MRKSFVAEGKSQVVKWITKYVQLTLGPAPIVTTKQENATGCTNPSHAITYPATETGGDGGIERG